MTLHMIGRWKVLVGATRWVALSPEGGCPHFPGLLQVGSETSTGCSE